MGKVHILTQAQESILDELRKSEYIKQRFYFSGGTALASYYLHHRYSEDLDFFSPHRFDNQAIIELVEEWSKRHKFSIKARFVEVVYRFELTFPFGEVLKLDLSYYPYQQIEPPKDRDGIALDSLTDIAVNKLLTVSQRTDVKDFVDLYFLLQQFSTWDLLEGVRQKFKMDQEPLLLAADFLKVEDFTLLPKMIKPLTIGKLKTFFREKAKEIGGKAVEP